MNAMLRALLAKGQFVHGYVNEDGSVGQWFLSDTSKFDDPVFDEMRLEYRIPLTRTEALTLHKELEE